MDHIMNPSPMSDDLSALAWVYEEVKKSLETAQKSLQRCLKESVTTGFSDVDAVDPAVLRTARQQIHQGVGALELAGVAGGATLLRASEALVQRYVNRPQSLDEEGVKAIESASFALLDYMRRRLAGKQVSVMALFPQYERLMGLAGADLARPSDLWVQEWPTLSLEVPVAPPADSAAREADVQAVDLFEIALLKLLRSGQSADARPLVGLCSDLAAGATARQAHRESATWVLACGFLQAIAEERLPVTVHVKRVLSALLSQLRKLAKGHVLLSDRLTHELLFFCAQAEPAPAADGDASAHAHAHVEAMPAGSVLDQLRQAFRLERHQPVDLRHASLGRFDPSWVAQAIKRVVLAKDGWSAVSAGELIRLGGLNEQFALVADSVRKLYQSGDNLASALTDTVSGTVASNQAPEATLAMEVATSLLYLEASLEEGEFDHPDELHRLDRLAQRMRQVQQGHEAEPLEPWMEALYRKVSDRQTIGSVVQELRNTLAECEKGIDQFFRDPTQTSALADAAGRLQSMKGVMAVLGLEQGSQAVVRMRQDVDALTVPDADLEAAAQQGVHDRLASNLSAVGFMVDMLGVQPNLVKSVFAFDADKGVLAPIMGRVATPAPEVDPVHVMARPAEQEVREHTHDVAESLAESVVRDDAALPELSLELADLAQSPLVQEQPDLAATVAEAQQALERAALAGDGETEQAAREQAAAALSDLAQAVVEPEPAAQEVEPLPAMQETLVPQAVALPDTGLEQDDEMRGIFLEEAREVLAEARVGLADMANHPDDVAAMTTVRRAFHTFKGSSRMVGLRDFGEAAWACEQLYNSCLASQAPVSDALLGLSAEVLDDLAGWIEDIAAQQDAHRSPQPIVAAADALRLEGRRIGLMPAAPEVTALEPFPVDLGHAPSDAEALSFTPDFTDTHSGETVESLHAAPDLDLPLNADVQSPALTAPLSPVALDDLPTLEVFDEPEPAVDIALDAHEPALAATEPMDLDLALGAEHPDQAETQPAPLVGEVGAIERLSLDLSALDDEPEVALAATDAGDAEGQPQAPQAAEATESEPVEESVDEQVKVIGDLRISIPLFNIFLNEADEQSRKLSTALSEWALEWHKPLGDEVVALAHSLAGNSGAVGYRELSGLARHLEHALEKRQAAGGGDEVSAELFNEAAEEIRRLLHQFAAGFLKAPSADLIERLEHYDAGPVAEAEWVTPEAGRPHLRLVKSSEDLAEPVDLLADASVAEPEPGHELIDLGGANLEVELGNEVQDPAVSIEAVADEGVAPDVAADEVGHDDAGAQPMPLGLPELKPFEPMAEPALMSLQAAEQAVDLGDDADIDAVDAIDPDLFPIFEEEAQELLPQLAADMRQWVAHPERMDLATACMRTLHTFKGGARLAGAMRLGELAHRMESAVERIVVREQAELPEIEALQNRSDVLSELFDALQRADLNQMPEQHAEPLQPGLSQPLAPVALHDAPESVSADAVLAAQADVLALEPGVLLDDPTLAAEPEAHDAESGGEPAGESLDEQAAAGTPDAEADEGQATPGLLATPVEAPVPQPIDWASVVGDFRPTDGAGAGEQQSAALAVVRVKPRLLDRLVNHSGEVSITRTRLASQLTQMRTSVVDMTDNLDRLRQQLRDIELQAETQLTTRMEAARANQAEFDPLEFDRYTRFQELTRMMAESVNDVATVQRGLVRNLETAEDQLAAQSRLTRDLQDDLLRTRMVEFEGLADRLYRVVRQAAKETGKQARLDIVGGQTEVDRGVLDRMTGAFEHVLRNCVTHGIEKPEAREAAGKPAMGAIVLAIRQEANEVSIEFRDDGAGLNLPRIRDKAVAQGLLAPDAEPTEAELAQLIFQPGFSTAETVTELAGRGIGMDVVRSDVNAMGGRIETATAAGQGTSFKLVLPLTTAVTKVVMVRCGDLVASIPTNLVEIVRRARADEVEAAYASGNVPYADLTLPFFWFGALLQHSPRGAAEGRSLPVVVVRSAQQRVALHVDEVLGNQDVVVKNLGPQLSRVPGLAGMTLLASGAISLIYNPVALATVYGQEAQHWARQAREDSLAAQALAAQVEAEASRVPLVLVVDDSLTVRRVTQRLLTREGYRVVLAKDGLDALERMAEETPTVVLSDIEMPRMDGFDLVRNLRGDARWRDIPVVMITSRIAQKHRDYAAELGVNHYLGKPYSEDELLSLVAGYTRAIHT
jgi:chemosensory pili system protein ChpA (sensor histidine kinase/response regulator)